MNRARNVLLLAVNLQELPDQVRATKERLQLAARVAFDEDGAVARQYQVNAIPQTVIVDREGKVARIFVGGGQKLEEQLREALQAVVGN